MATLLWKWAKPSPQTALAYQTGWIEGHSRHWQQWEHWAILTCPQADEGSSDHPKMTAQQFEGSWQSSLLQIYCTAVEVVTEFSYLMFQHLKLKEIVNVLGWVGFIVSMTSALDIPTHYTYLFCLCAGVPRANVMLAITWNKTTHQHLMHSPQHRDHWGRLHWKFHPDKRPSWWWHPPCLLMPASWYHRSSHSCPDALWRQSSQYLSSQTH